MAKVAKTRAKIRQRYRSICVNSLKRNILSVMKNMREYCHVTHPMTTWLTTRKIAMILVAKVNMYALVKSPAWTSVADDLTTKKIAKPRAPTHFPMVFATGSLKKKMSQPLACQSYVDVRLDSTRWRRL